MPSLSKWTNIAYHKMIGFSDYIETGFNTVICHFNIKKIRQVDDI